MNSQKEISDEQLIQEFLNPNSQEKAFKNIVEKYQERLYWHIRRILVDHEDTNDVLQNTFIKAWKNLEKFRGDSSLYTWLYRIGTNESLTFLEVKKRKTQHHLANNEIDFTTLVKGDKDFDFKKLEWKLQLAIQSLPEKQKIVFCMRYYDEVNYDDMSKILDTSAGALKASYHHAAKKIEEFLLNN